MRSATRIFRSLRPHGFLSSPQLQRPFFSRPCQWQTLLRTLVTTTGEANVDLIPRAEPLGTQIPLSQKTGSENGFVQGSEAFGKWQWLLTNVDRLIVETDFDREGPAKKWRQTLLVDRLENHGDFDLWNCLLDHLQRHHGDAGVCRLWGALWGRKSLYQVKGTPARVFWRTILEAFLRMDNMKFLDGAWLYAEWMTEIHGTVWPDLYLTIVPYFLRTHQYHSAKQWHLRLAPRFYPGSREFVNMVHHFVTDQELSQSFTLPSLYIASPERQLYDVLVPYLYGRGQLKLAGVWRKICIKQDDGPRLHAPARSYLRFLKGYFRTHRESLLHPSEALAMEESESDPDPGQSEETQPELSREYMNRIHGKTFGFTVKTYNDQLGARWFASTWVGLDMAISFVAALGIREIGPLSVQSIALREDTPQALLARFSQLQDSGISIPNSGYVNTIRYFATVGERGLLSDLLRSDFHPDVFDDIELQARLMNSAIMARDLRTYMLMMGSRLASINESTRKAANALLNMYRLRDDRNGMLWVLDDIRATQTSLDADQSALLFKYVLDHVPLHPTPHILCHQNLDFGVALCRRLAAMDIPIPVICWRRLLFCLGRLSRLDEFLRISVELVDYYTTRESARPGFFPVHMVDVPEVIQKPLEGVENLIGIYIPLETPPDSQMHPLTQIFDTKLRTSFVRWSFRKLPETPRSTALVNQELRRRQDTVMGRAISLIRHFHDRGLNIQTSWLQKVLILRFAELYGKAPPAKLNHRAARRVNVLTLGQMKMLCDEAWGEEFLPDVAELKGRIELADVQRQKDHEKYMKTKVRAHHRNPTI